MTEVMGTAEFMSPEQARGAEVDARSDLYSLGCVGFFALSGRVPFTGPTPAAILGQHLTQPAPRLTAVAPQAPPGVATVLDRCLRKEPERRFSDGEALAEALSPATQIDRDLPLPLRVFIKQVREFESTLAWCGGGLLFFVPALLSAVYGAGPSGVIPLGSAVAVLMGIPVVRLLRHIRRLLRSGFTVEHRPSSRMSCGRTRSSAFRSDRG
jgi:serine/threonine-protein kinase